VENIPHKKEQNQAQKYDLFFCISVPSYYDVIPSYYDVTDSELKF